MISQERALEIAKAHHGNKFELFRITDGIPDNCSIYNFGEWSPDDVWCIFCSAYPGRKYILASSRVIIISKDTGEILFDGSASEEG